MHRLEHTMPINQVGEIAYQPAAPMEGIRWQADPPVCNRCWHEIPPPEFWAGLRRGLYALPKPL